MARESCQATLDAVWKAYHPAPRTLTELWKAFARRRGLADTQFNRVQHWKLIKTYYYERHGYAEGIAPSQHRKGIPRQSETLF